MPHRSINLPPYRDLRRVDFNRRVNRKRKDAIFGAICAVSFSLLCWSVFAFAVAHEFFGY